MLRESSNDISDWMRSLESLSRAMRRVHCSIWIVVPSLVKAIPMSVTSSPPVMCKLWLFLLAILIRVLLKRWAYSPTRICTVFFESFSIRSFLRVKDTRSSCGT